MLKAFKYRIYPSKAQVAKLEATLALCCELYNAALQERRDAYRISRTTINYHAQAVQLPEIKEIRPDLNRVHSQVLQEVLRRLDKAFDAFFRRVKAGEKPGFPHFRARARYDSFTFSQSGFAIEHCKLRLSKIGDVEIELHRPVEGKIKTLIITRTPTGKWYACFSVEIEPEPLPECSKAAGVDVGMKTFAAVSDGTMIDNPRFFREDAHDLARAQRRLSEAKRGTKEHAKARKIVARIHERIAARRRDFAHKLSRWLVDNYGIIIFEKLTIKNMVKNHCLALSISDAAWNLLISFTEYKAEEAGRLFAQVNPNGTSQMCSGCSVKVEKTLSERVHSCSNCGIVLDRDLNAAINILRLGLQSLGVPRAQTMEAASF